MSLWLEKTPPHFLMMPSGYLHVTFSLKEGDQVKPVRQSVLFQLRVATPAPEAKDTVPPDPVFVCRMNNSLLSSSRRDTALVIEGYADSTKQIGDDNPAYMISSAGLADFLDRNLVTPCCAMQTRSTVYKKVELAFHYSKAKGLVSGSGNLSALRCYYRVKLTMPPTACGQINSDRPPAIGAIAINQYAGGNSEDTTNKVVTKQQDKPGRFLIRGAAVSQEDALRGTNITKLTNFLRDGDTIVPTGGPSLVPIVDVMGDLWEVRAAQSAGYVRVAAQGSRNPREAQPREGAS